MHYSLQSFISARLAFCITKYSIFVPFQLKGGNTFQRSCGCMHFYILVCSLKSIYVFLGISLPCFTTCLISFARSISCFLILSALDRVLIYKLSFFFSLFTYLQVDFEVIFLTIFLFYLCAITNLEVSTDFCEFYVF